MDKKRGLKIFSFVLIVISIIPFVSAQYGYFDFRDSAEQIIQWLQDIFTPFFEFLLGVSNIDEYFFARILFLILVYVIVLTTLKRTPAFRDNPFAYILISAIVSILGARYIGGSEIVKGLLIPYGTITIAISVLLPFVIYLLFVEGTMDNPIWRRVAWIFYGVVLFGIWISRADEIGELGWIYGIAFGALVFIFIFDRWVKGLFIKAEVASGGALAKREMVANLQEKINKIRMQMQQGNYPGGISQAKRDIKAYKKAIVEIRNS